MTTLSTVVWQKWFQSIENTCILYSDGSTKYSLKRKFLEIFFILYTYIFICYITLIFSVYKGANSLEGITSHSVVHIPKCARYHSQRQTPGLDKAIRYAGDMAITATAKYAERLVQTLVITNFSYWISVFVGVVQP